MAYVSLDSDQIKKAHKKHKYNKTQVDQLEKCMDPKTGPLFFMESSKFWELGKFVENKFFSWFQEI